MRSSLPDVAESAESVVNIESGGGIVITWLEWLKQGLADITEDRLDELNMFGTLLLLVLLVCGWLYTSFTHPKKQPQV